MSGYMLRPVDQAYPPNLLEWQGPYVVVSMASEATCYIQPINDPAKQPFLVHFNWLKPDTTADYSQPANPMIIAEECEVPPEGGPATALRTVLNS
ncbi:unnamed protein product [Echinostoma caproni]|uniref:Conserved hypothethical protein n=1 Tax=Echinostoma caproni TaxID=27848 RepID=A0A183A047_9TREM|nr:unnamed protein product [Echinostoma caproni]